MKIYGTRETSVIIGEKCDSCGKSTENGEFIPIKIEFGYGLDLDGTIYDFCSNECAINFLTNELKKEKK